MAGVVEECLLLAGGCCFYIAEGVAFWVAGCWPVECGITNTHIW